MNKNSLIHLLALSLLLATTASPTTASAGGGSPTMLYAGSGALVVGQESSPGGPPGTFDQGTMTCSSLTGDGVGGFCVHDNSAEAISVTDATAPSVAYQVCRDENLNRICTDEETIFSHGNNGVFANPVDVPGTPGTGQIVVFICNGVHTAGGAHEHHATAGEGFATADPRPSVLDGFTADDGFCGFSVVGKLYLVA